MGWRDLADDLQEKLRLGDLDRCIACVEYVLTQCQETPLRVALGLQFTNNPADIAIHFDRFANSEPMHTLDVLYAEMNGFFINPDRWYFELFGIQHHGGHIRYGWLANVKAHHREEVALTGMESLQNVYAGHLEEAQTLERKGIKLDDFEDILGVTDLLIVLRFQDLIRRSVPYMNQVKQSILVTAHDYDFIYEIHSNPSAT